MYTLRRTSLTALHTVLVLVDATMDSTTANADVPHPPQLPKTDEVDKEVALRYLDMYREYIATYSQSCERDDKKKQTSVPSSRNSSVAPSQSASQTGQVIPGIVRTDSRSSLLTYSPPDTAAPYTGLIVNGNTDEPGFCYLALFRSEHYDTARLHLGRYPKFQDIMMMDRSLFLDDNELSLLQISRTTLKHYHVLTGTIMPNVVSTLAAIAEASCLPAEEGTLYRWAASVMPREGLAPKAPELSDVLGSGSAYYQYSTTYSPNGVEYTRTYTSPATYRPYVPHVGYRSYVPPIAYREHDRRSSPPPRQHRRPTYRSENVAHSSSNRSHSARRISDRGRSILSPRRRPRSPSPGTYYERDEDVDYERILRESVAESRRRRDTYNSTYDFGDISREVDIIERLPHSGHESSGINRETSGVSHISSTTSTSSIKVYGSLQGIQCGICMEVIDEGAGFLRCGHVFHSDCVDIWLESHGTCPECRSTQR